MTESKSRVARPPFFFYIGFLGLVVRDEGLGSDDAIKHFGEAGARIP